MTEPAPPPVPPVPLVPPLRERLRGLAAWADRLADPGFDLGHWEPSTTGADGVMHLGWYELGADGDRFLRDVGALGWLQPFDWPAWLRTPEGQRLAADPGAVAEATAEDLGRLLTAIVRSERTHEGSIEGAHRRGLLVAIARRAAVLAEAGSA